MIRYTIIICLVLALAVTSVLVDMVDRTVVGLAGPESLLRSVEKGRNHNTSIKVIV